MLPLFSLQKGRVKVKEELRLISIGFPLSEALSICYSLKKEGTLEDFIQQQEKEYRKQCEQLAKEAIG